MLIRTRIDNWVILALHLSLANVTYWRLFHDSVFDRFGVYVSREYWSNLFIIQLDEGRNDYSDPIAYVWLTLSYYDLLKKSLTDELCIKPFRDTEVILVKDNRVRRPDVCRTPNEIECFHNSSFITLCYIDVVSDELWLFIQRNTEVTEAIYNVQQAEDCQHLADCARSEFILTDLS